MSNNSPLMLEKITDEESYTLTNYLKAYNKIGQMSDRELVNLSLEYLHGSDLQHLLIQELCTRVYANWDYEDPCQICGSLSMNHVQADEKGPCREVVKFAEFAP